MAQSPLSGRADPGSPVSGCSGASARSVLLLGQIRGVLVALLLSVIDVIRRAANPPIDALGRAEGRARFVKVILSAVQRGRAS